MENISINYLVNEIKNFVKKQSRISRVSLKSGYLECRLGNQYLFFSSIPRSAPFFLSENRLSADTGQSSDINVLRKYLEAGTLIAIEKPRDERIIDFHISKLAIWGEEQHFHFIVNAGSVPTRWAITDGEYKIIWIRNDPEAIAGTQFQWPKDNRAPLSSLKPEALSEFSSPRDLYTSVCGLGPAFAAEILASSEPELLLSDLLQAQPGQGFVYGNRVFPVPMKTLGKPDAVKPDMSSALAEQHLHKLEQEKFQQTRSRAEKKLRREIDKKRNLLKKLGKEIQSCNKNTPLLRKAETLSAHFQELKPGLKTIRLPDLQNNILLDISLDPELTPPENISRLYRKAARLKRKLPLIQERIQVVQSELAALEDDRYSVEQAACLDDLRGILPEKPMKKGRKKEKIVPGIRRIELGNGFFAYVGRNSIGNQTLYSQKLGPKDLWFHAKDIPGSHVILKNPGGKPIPPALVEKAAQLAAAYSAAGSNTLVEVQYTSKRNLYSSKGKGRGFVLLRKFKTILVKPGGSDAMDGGY
ncbi:MAG: DUF814 domain-containing protein [Acidobacteria bacterium]|nr:DUF814 domain-containing protein [Acidobacteriota bacterium]